MKRLLPNLFLAFCGVFMMQMPKGLAKSLSYEQIAALPKAELHLHLGGSYPLEFLLGLANDQQKKNIIEELDFIAKGLPSYHEIFKVFTLVAEIVNTNRKVTDGTKALCSQLKQDGVAYAEIRTGLKNLEGKGFEAYVLSILQALTEEKRENFTGKLLLSLQRNSSQQMIKTTVDLALKYKDQGIVGIDISGDSTIGDIKLLFDELLRAKQEGLCLTVHLGESLEEQDQLLTLETLMPDRIGHGVHLREEALQWILTNKTPIEVCLSSGVFAQMIKTPDMHPACNYYKAGHPIIICTDDPLIFSTNLTKELQIFAGILNLELAELTQIVQGGFGYSFL